MANPPCCSKLELVFWQFISSPRDAVSDAIISSAGTRSSSNSASRVTSSAKSRSENECGTRHSIRACANSSFQQPVHTSGKSLVPAHAIGKHQIQLWTKHSQTGMHEHSWLSCCTVLWFICLVGSNQSDDRLSESKAARNQVLPYKLND